MAFSVATGYVNNDGGLSVTSGSFDVVAGDEIIVVGNADQNATPTVDITWLVTDNQTPDLTYTLIGQRDDFDGLTGAVVAYRHTVVSNITGLTITLTVAGSGADSPAIKVFKYPAGEFDSADPVGAQTEGDWTTDGQQTGNITPETSGVGVVVCTDWNQTGTPTSADTTFTGFDTAGDISGGSGYVALTAGVAKNADMNSGGTPSGTYLWFEMRAAAAGGTTPKGVFSKPFSGPFRGPFA